MLQQFLGQQKSMRGHGSKQELKKINVVAFINWDPQKIPNLRTRFSMGGDGGGIHWPTVESDGRKCKTCSF